MDLYAGVERDPDGSPKFPVPSSEAPSQRLVYERMLRRNGIYEAATIRRLWSEQRARMEAKNACRR